MRCQQRLERELTAQTNNAPNRVLGLGHLLRIPHGNDTCCVTSNPAGLLLRF